MSAGALFGATGVALGAWGAHGLETFLNTSHTGAWDTAVLYQLVHAPVLLLTGLWMRATPSRGLVMAGCAFAAGIGLFSGSIFALTLGAPGWLGPVTPLGGGFLILGWLTLLSCALRGTTQS